jgi:competence protein ComEA
MGDDAARADATLAGGLLYGRAVDVNAASADDLAALPGIGPQRARRIISHREAHGPFRAVGDLAAVPGIGPATARRLEEGGAVSTGP